MFYSKIVILLVVFVASLHMSLYAEESQEGALDQPLRVVDETTVSKEKLFDDVKMRLNDLESKLRREMSKVSNLQNKLERLSQRVERLQRLEDRLSRVDALESKVGRLDDEINGLRRNLS